MDIKEKLEDIQFKIIDRYKDIRCWLHHCFNIYKFRTTKEAITGYPFDYGYLYTLELAKLQEMKYYFERANLLQEKSYKNILKYINLAIEMLYIVMDDGRGKYKNGLFRTVHVPRTKEHPFTWDLVSNIEHVNKKNVKRFGAYPEWRDWDIYQAKALYLYHKIMWMKSQDWWD